MFTLHIANKNYSSWSLRPWVLMRELDIPFTEELHPFPDSGPLDQYRQFSPSGKVPWLEHDGIVIWDSLAIVEYLAELCPGVWPHERHARAWARSTAAEMHSGFQALRSTCGMTCGHRIQLPALTAELHKDLSRIDELWCDGLARFGGPFLAGNTFTAVDAFFAPVVFRIQTYALPLSDTAAEYHQFMLARPSLQEWYKAALLEPWRDKTHEQEALAAGKVLLDLRQPL